MVIDITWRKKEIRAWWVCFGSAFIRRTNSPAEVPHPGARPHIRHSLELPCLSPAFINLPEVLSLCVVTSVFWNFSGSLSGLFLPKAFQWTFSVGSIWQDWAEKVIFPLLKPSIRLLTSFWINSSPFYPLKQQTRLHLKPLTSAHCQMVIWLDLSELNFKFSWTCVFCSNRLLNQTEFVFLNLQFQCLCH